MASLPDAWSELRTATPQPNAGGYRLRLIETKAAIRVYAAITEPDFMPALLIELPSNLRPRRLAVNTRAFEALVAEFPGLPSGKSGLAIRLRDNSFDDLFATFLEEIVTVIRNATTQTDAANAVIRCIERWRRFIERGRRGLSDEEVRGLIGELVVLARCIGRFGPRVAVDSWKGPFDSIRDFELPDATVEVKTYQVETGASVRINDPQQLEEAPGRPLHLCVVHLSQSESGGQTLAEFISVIAQLFVADPAIAELFEGGLASYGYLPLHAPQYTDRFLAGPLVLHTIGPGFPRIRTAEIPQGIADVRFSLSLAAIAPFVADAVTVVGAPLGGLETVG